MSIDFILSYQNPDYLKDTERAQCILAGSCIFETLDIEIYAETNWSF